LEDWQIKSLNHEFTSSSDLCFHCGKPGHFANTCPNLIFDVDQFVDKYNDEFSIEQQIARIKELIKNVYYTKKNIEALKACTIENYEILVKNKKNFLTITIPKTDLFHSRRGSEQIQSALGDKYNDFKEFQEMKLHIKNLHQIFLSKEDDEHLSIEIKALELVNFNINMQKQLDSLLNEFKTEEIIKEILVKLYEKLIGIKSQI